MSSCFSSFIVLWILNFVDQPTHENHENWYPTNRNGFTVYTSKCLFSLIYAFILDKIYILFYQHKHLIIDSKHCIDSFTYIYIKYTPTSYVCLSFINFMDWRFDFNSDYTPTPLTQNYLL